MARDYCTGELAFASPSFSGWVGVDISTKMLNLAAAKGMSVVLASSSHLPFADASFDSVTAFTSLGLAGCLEAEMREAARVLKPGGILVLSILPEAQAQLLPALEKLRFELLMRTPCGQDEGYVLKSQGSWV